MLTILEAIKSRNTSFRITNAALKQLKLPTAQGWLPLIEKFRTPPVDDIGRDRWSNGLNEIYINNLLYGDKAVVFLDAEEDVVTEIARYLPTFLNTSSQFLTVFPLPLTDSQLMNAPLMPEAVKFEEDNGVFRLSLCSKRYFTERTTLFTADYDDDVRETFSDYDELIGVRRGVYQAFDYIVARPSDKRVELHIDLSRHMNGGEISKASASMRDMFLTWAESACGIQDNQFKRRNFFPLVNILYNSSDGTLLRMDHATSTGSVKSERMRRHGQDLREEGFHHAGMAAVVHTDGYGIIKEWVGPSAIARPSVTINGHSAMAGSDGASIGYAIIGGCYDEDDFQMVLEKLETV